MTANDMFDLTGTVVVVTGGGRGLGITMTHAVAARGAHVAVLGRRSGPLEAQVEALNDRHGEGTAAAVVCDVADEDSVDGAAAQVREYFGRADALINNAGISWGEAITSIDRSRWEKVLATNLTGTMLCSRHFLPLLEQSPSSSIVAVSSATAVRGVPFMNAAAYTIAKAGTEQFVREAAAAWAPKNVRVNALRLGFFDSDMTSAFLSQGSNQNSVNQMTAMGRIGHPEELVGAIQFLVSRASSYMTGSIVTLDGGALALLGPRT